jgi:serine/threonine protein kinase
VLHDTNVKRAVDDAGEKCPLGFTLKYAAPELVDAYEGNQQVTCAATAADIWALGIIAFELLTKEPAFRVGAADGEVRDALMQRSTLPWEDRVRKPLHAPELAALRPTVLACLARSASKRMSAVDVAKGWRDACATL